MNGTMAEFTIREVREGNKCKVQLVVNGEVVKETSLRDIGLSGHPLYLNIFEKVKKSNWRG